jgi:N-acetylneuraminate synthase/N,N'-diacetyllegionaminate synthase
MNKTVKIRDRLVGAGEPAFIIAEIGSNHDRNLRQAKELIDVVAESKADAVKFQLFKAEGFYSRSDPMFSVMKENELPREWVPELYEYVQDKGIIFLASPFDEEAVDILQEVGSPAFKIASSETVNLSLVRYIALKKKPLIISTGMCNLADVYEAVEVVYATGNEGIILLHTSSLYPTEPQDVNLLAMDTLSNAFHLPVGYSDHTLGLLMPAVAVARGACVIEKHLTLSRTLKGPDHSYALEPDEFKQMVKAIREVEQSLGSPEVKMLPGEKKSARRNSIIAKTDIPKGTVITKDMILVKRPALGIEPRFIEGVVGQRTKRNIKKDEAVIWDMIE